MTNLKGLAGMKNPLRNGGLLDRLFPELAMFLLAAAAWKGIWGHVPGPVTVLAATAAVLLLARVVYTVIRSERTGDRSA
ncbi:hypothetical protein [Streptomyces sp. N35]|uniref:hypothetical protein n=1 Tax=Streptomyces sp. N35 TaxID=2795730 RepID=UPI0018F700C5|nr:hypothetical protein [Streptomyces sp. N35]